MATQGFADLSLIQGRHTVTAESSMSRQGASVRRRREGNARLVGYIGSRNAVSVLLAYRMAVLRSCDVDQPSNLAKSVTVD
jgi:glucosamine 6-phosphate synthetase-like amidotransferase/phosphosugar isomerase protein